MLFQYLRLTISYMQAHFLGFGHVAALALLAHQPLIAQKTPYVEGVWSVVGGALSPGVLAEIYGSGFSKEATVEIEGRRATVTGFSPTAWGEEYEYLYIQIPFEVEPGPATLLVTTGDGSSRPFPIKLNTYAPGLYSHFIGAGGRKYPSCSSGGTPSRGELLTVKAVGLGRTQPDGSTLIKPSLTLGGQPAELLSAGASADVGIYDVSFRAPVVEGPYDVVLSIAGHRSNTQFLAVGNAVLHSHPVTAADTIITAAPCGGTLVTATLAADPRNPPDSLSEITVRVKDAAGMERLARLLYVSPYQVNYIVPSGTAGGKANVTITSGGGTLFTGALDIRMVAPQLFVVGWAPAGLVVRMRNGMQSIESPVQNSTIFPRPIDMGPESDQLFLLLFGTGLRFGSKVSVMIGGTDMPIEYAGPQNEFPGLDQVNVRLTRSLAGRGTLDLQLAVDGELANPARVAFQ